MLHLRKNCNMNLLYNLAGRIINGNLPPFGSLTVAVRFRSLHRAAPRHGTRSIFASGLKPLLGLREHDRDRRVPVDRGLALEHSVLLANQLQGREQLDLGALAAAALGPP